MSPIRIFRLSLLLFSLSSFISLCSASAVKQQSSGPDSVIVLPLPDDPNTSLGYNDIECTDANGNIVTGDYCYDKIQSALVSLLVQIENVFGAYAGNPNEYEGYLYGFDYGNQVVASIFYNIPEDAFNPGWGVFFSNDDPDGESINVEIADEIISGLQSNNIIEGCLQFQTNYNTFETGTVLLMIGWWDKAYYIEDISTAEEYLTRCINET